MPAPLLSTLPALYLYPLNDSFVPKHISLSPPGQRVKIGRQTNAKTTPGERNGYFDSKVLSRQHAEIWEENGKIYIKDVKSSNGTFINGERLSQEGAESDPFELKSDDIVEFGIDIVGEDNKTIVHHKVAARVMCIFTEQDALLAARSEQHLPSASSSSLVPNSSQPALSNAIPKSASGMNGAGSAQFPPRLTGMGGMGGSMRPPGKSGLTFEHILTRLQGELQKSRETGAELGALSGTMGDIGETLGGAVPPAAPAYPNPANLPPVRPPTQRDEEDAKKPGVVAELMDKLKEHEHKVRVLEDKLKEQETMWSEIRNMLLVKQRAEQEEREYREQQREREQQHDEEHEAHPEYDDDDARSIATVTGGLDTVDEEEEPEEDTHSGEPEEQEQHIRPRTPEPSLALQTESEAEPEREEEKEKVDYGSLINELTFKVSQLTEQLAESRGAIRGLEEKVAALSDTPPSPPPPTHTGFGAEFLEKWEEMARRVGKMEESIENGRQHKERSRSVEVLPPSPRSLSSDSMRQRRRGRSSSVKREHLVDALSNGNGNGKIILMENGHRHTDELLDGKEHANGVIVVNARGPIHRKEATMTALGIVILGVAAAAVVWRVKE